jgi:hypothetical protein
MGNSDLTQTSEILTNNRGEKAWSPLMMFKALLLQSWYNLSDPGLEKHPVRDLWGMVTHRVPYLLSYKLVIFIDKN